MKRSTQWDLVGIIGLFIGVASWISLTATGGFFSIGSVNVWFGNPFIAGFGILFGFMCFVFGYLQSRKEA